MNIFKHGIRLLARYTGVEEDIQADQRIETANHLALASEFFKKGFTPNTKVANALAYYSFHLKKGTKKPDLHTMKYAVTVGGNNPLFEMANPLPPKPEA